MDGAQQGPQQEAAGRRNGTDGAAMSSQQAGTALAEPQATRQRGARLARPASPGGAGPEHVLPAAGQPAALVPSHAELSGAAKAAGAAASCQEVHSEAEQAARAEEGAAEGCAPLGAPPAAACELQSPTATRPSPEQPLPGKQQHCSSVSERHWSDSDAQKQVSAVVFVSGWMSTGWGLLSGVGT